MKSPSRRDFEDTEDYNFAVMRYESWSETEREHKRELELDEQPAPVTQEAQWEGSWEAWCEENWRTEN